MIKKYLLAPGPTPVPESVLLAMAQPIFHHRTPQFEALFAETAKSLQKLFKTAQDVIMLASSGTGAMEAAVTNTTSPGDRVLVVNGGKFGERWGKISANYGLTVTELKVEWGTAVDPAAIAKALKEHPETKLVLMQGSETSTTVLHPVAEVAKITRESDTLLVVDGITAVGVLDLPMDALGIDVLLTGSQKALMLPPGLAFIALSDKAWTAAAASKQPRFYFDLKRERDNQQKHTTAWTPAISLIFGLHEALRLMFEEGLDNVFARHDRLARATRAGAEALGLKLVAPTAPSPATTGIYLPDGVPGKVVGYLRDKVGITFAGGQDQLKGKICRVAHLGYIGSFDIITAMAALEMGIAAFGKPVDFGKGVGAAQKILDGRHACRAHGLKEDVMTYRVLATDPLDQQGVDVFTANPEISLDLKPGMKPDELARVIGEYDALVIRSGSKVTADTLKNHGKLRAIGRAGIGVDNIDVAAATARGIVVMNTPGGNNVTTAEHAITLMLAVARWIPQADASLRNGKWERTKFTGTEVCNKTLGIVGLGNIGAIVAERAQGLRMRVIGYDPFVTAEAAARLKVELVSLDDLYARADFISVHVPMTPETKGLINAAAFAKMKKGVRVINAARGGIVDEAALHDAITSGKVAGAALDVFAEEPPPKDHPLLALPQVVVTPHLGAATSEAQINVAIAIAEQITNFLVRGEVQAAVNMPSVSAEMLQLLRPHLQLGEKLGSFLAQLSTEPPTEIAVEYAGTVAELDVRPVTIAVLRGLLTRFIDDVNYVNAPALARERGIVVKEARASQPTNFVNSITVKVTRSSGSQVVEGAVFGTNILRLVRIDDFYMEAVPEGYVLMLNNRDVPGVVGRVGTMLGQHGINIAGLELGREKAGGMAISFVHVDEAVPETVLAELRRSPDIVAAQLLQL